jgi:hypothetical protein
MTNFDALNHMVADHRADLASQAQDRRLAGRRPASRWARAKFALHRILSPPHPRPMPSPPRPQLECGR